MKLNEYDISHCDIKPDNIGLRRIIIEKDGYESALLDFGGAALAYDDEPINYVITPHYYLNETTRLTEDYNNKTLKFHSKFDRILAELYCISITNLEVLI